MSSTPVKSPLANKTPDQLKVTELKEELKRRGVNTKGLKKDLVERLEGVLRDEHEAARAQEAAVAEPEVHMAEATVTESELKVPAVNQSDIVAEVTKTEEVVTEMVTEQVVTADENKIAEYAEKKPEETAPVVEVTTTVTETVSTEVTETITEEIKPDQSVLTMETVEEIKEERLMQEQVHAQEPVEPMVEASEDAAKLEAPVETAIDVETKEELKEEMKEELKEEMKEELKDELKEELKGELQEELTEDLKGKQQVKEETVVETTVTEEVVVESLANDGMQNVESAKESIASAEGQTNGSQPEGKVDSPPEAEEVHESNLMDVDTAAQVGQKRKEPAETQQVDQNKRQRRWNSGKNLGAEAEARPKVTELTVNVGSNVAGSDSFGSRPSADRAALSRPVVSPGSDTPNNGRIVSPSSKNPTTSLRIDRFVRPFTLKALKDLLAETGTVSDFWMDQIKTHCYVTYSSVEEAVATRAALHNLKWPVVGGRQLIAEFVEPEEVKQKCESGNDKPAATTPRTFQSPTPFAHRERAAPPPKREAEPIVTLDDLFKKTNARPQIYYLPLTEAQVAAKLSVKS